MHSFGGLYLNDPIYRESKRMGSLLIHLSISFQGEGRERRTFPASGEEDMQFFKKKLQFFGGRPGALLLVGAASCNEEELSYWIEKSRAALRFQRLLSPVARPVRF